MNGFSNQPDDFCDEVDGKEHVNLPEGEIETEDGPTVTIMSGEGGLAGLLAALNRMEEETKGHDNGRDYLIDLAADAGVTLSDEDLAAADAYDASMAELREHGSKRDFEYLNGRSYYVGGRHVGAVTHAIFEAVQFIPSQDAARGFAVLQERLAGAIHDRDCDCGEKAADKPRGKLFRVTIEEVEEL